MIASADLIEIDEGEYELWPWFVLRAPGFPVETVLRLASEQLGEAVEEALEARARTRERLEAIQSEIGARLARASDPRSARKLLAKARRQLERPGSAELLAAAVDAGLLDPELVVRWADASEGRERAEHAYTKAYANALARQRGELHARTADPRFGEALLWQNAHAYRTARRRVFEQLRVDKRLKESERLIARYAQRYAVKNDTIGFFGPSAYGTFTRSVARVSVPTTSVLAERVTHLEAWAVEALAGELARRPTIRPRLRPIRNPGIRVCSQILHVPSQLPVPLTEVQLAVLAACDGERSAREIAHRATDANADEITQVLEQFAMVKVIEWDFHLSPEPGCFAELRRQIEALGEPVAVAEGLQAWDRLEDARRRVAEAAGDPEALDDALAGLDAEFEALTRRRSTRRAGTAYGARTLVYEDCRRDGEVALPASLFDVAGPPLALILRSTRWFTEQTARVVRPAAMAAFERLRESERARPPLFELWLDMLQKTDWDATIGAAELELRAKWRRVFDLPARAAQRSIEVSSDELRDAVQREFGDARPAWGAVRHHSPDLMIAAASMEAIDRGDYRVVLGELHAGLVTMRNYALDELSPFRAEVRAAYARDMAGTHLEFLPPPSTGTLTARTNRAFHGPDAILVAPPGAALEREGVPSVPVSKLYVEELGGRLVVRDGDGLELELLEAIGQIAARTVLTCFVPFDERPHLPRLVVDDVVLARETWTVELDELTTFASADPAARFLAFQEWAHAKGIPRWCFVRSPSETKPFFVDRRSPILVDILLKSARDAARATESEPLRISEMLPTFDELWLRDEDGGRYTAELRLVLHDRRTPPAS